MDKALSTIESVRTNYDVEAIRADFPILAKEINGHPLAFLDSSASAQKPEAVLQCMDEVYRGSTDSGQAFGDANELKSAVIWRELGHTQVPDELYVADRRLRCALC